MLTAHRSSRSKNPPVIGGAKICLFNDISRRRRITIALSTTHCKYGQALGACGEISTAWGYQPEKGSQSYVVAGERDLKTLDSREPSPLWCQYRELPAKVKQELPKQLINILAITPCQDQQHQSSCDLRPAESLGAVHSSLSAPT